MHFHGPVEGPAFEVKVPYIIPHHHDEHAEHNHLHDHLGYVLDYTAHPKYEYKYGVEDYHTGDFHSQKETRDGKSLAVICGYANCERREKIVVALSIQEKGKDE